MVIEDHPDFRATLEIIINNNECFSLVGAYANAESALRNLQNRGGSDDVNILLLDLNLPGMNGLEAIPWVQKYSPKTKIIILSQNDHEKVVLNSIQSGIAGYLLKSATMNDIVRSIEDVHEDGACLDPSLAKFVIKTLQQHTVKVTKHGEYSLSARELEVISAIAEGNSQKEIGSKLGISTYTVTDHLKSIYCKLDVQNAPQAVAKAIQSGLIEV